jgi:hypothetical protein
VLSGKRGFCVGQGNRRGGMERPRQKRPGKTTAGMSTVSGDDRVTATTVF